MGPHFQSRFDFFFFNLHLKTLSQGRTVERKRFSPWKKCAQGASSSGSSRLRLNWNWEGSSHAQHWEKKNCSTKKECDHVIISALPVCAFLMLPAAETFSVLDGPLCTRIVPPITKRITDLNFYTPFHWCLDLVRKPTAVPFESEKYHRITLPNPFSKWNGFKKSQKGYTLIYSGTKCKRWQDEMTFNEKPIN